MKLTFSHERILAVVAHPDDAELFCAGTLARARAEGACIGICVLCRGDKGQGAIPVPDLALVRWQEMTEAASLLGAELFTLDCPDGTLADRGRLRRKLVHVYRRFRPTLVLAHSPADYHPDHRAAGALAEAASWFCASRGYQGNALPLEAAPALWWMDTLAMHDFQPGLFIDISGHVAVKEQMLSCHKSQVARAGDRDFAPLLTLVRQQCQARGLQAGVAAAEAFAACHAFKRARAW
jgi:LmbE family N-acetylglucosaminyl deacetylase